MKLIDGVKKVFPKPNIPQSRYLVLICLLVYVGLKLYTIHTPTEKDDHLPDDFSNAAQIILSHNDYYINEDGHEDEWDDPGYGEKD